jgi:hypothetical protein
MFGMTASLSNKKELMTGNTYMNDPGTSLALDSSP